MAPAANATLPYWGTYDHKRMLANLANMAVLDLILRPHPARLRAYQEAFGAGGGMSQETFDQFFARYFPDGWNAGVPYYGDLDSRIAGATSVLDLGCGDNRALARYRTAGRSVWGTDFTPHPNLFAPESFRTLSPNGTVPFPDETFDVIASCWVLEHVREPVRYLAEVRRLLRPGGAFVSLSVNAWHYTTGITRLLGLLPHALTQRLVRRLYGRATHDTFPTYYRLNTPAALRRHARQAGLDLVSLTRVANAGYFSFSPRLYRLAVRVDWLLDRLAADLGRVYFVATLQKASPSRASLRDAGRRAA